MILPSVKTPRARWGGQTKPHLAWSAALILVLNTCTTTTDTQLMSVLAGSNATFEIRDAPAAPSISSDRAVVIAKELVPTAPTNVDVRFGRLRSTQLAIDSDSWLVILDGTAPAVLRPTAGATPSGHPRTYAFIDSTSGRNLLLVGIGATTR